MSTRIMTSFAVLATFVCVQMAFGQSSSNLDPYSKARDEAPYRFSVTPEKYLDLVFKDGRQARAVIEFGEKGWVRYGLNLDENTCVQEPMPNAGCYLEYNVETAEVHFKWIRHQDPAKIGQNVRRAGGRQPVKREISFDLLNARFIPGVLNDYVQAPLLVCNRYDWLPGGDLQTPPARVHIREWTFEDRLNNSETGIEELRVEKAFIDLYLKATRANDLQVTSLGHPVVVSPDESFAESLFRERNQYWTVSTQDGKACMISFKPDGLIDVSGALTNLKPKTRPTAPLVFSNDDPLILTIAPPRGQPFQNTDWVWSRFGLYNYQLTASGSTSKPVELE